MHNSKKIGLALSGGGYRAAAFHLGTFKCLERLRLIDKVDVISTISGGSIAGAFYLLNKKSFENNLIKALGRSVIYKVIFSWQFLIRLIALFIIWGCMILFVDDIWLTVLLILITIIVTLAFLFKIIPLTKLKERAYRKIFFGDSTLKDFPDEPKIAINSTNLDSGRLMTFSKNKISDSYYRYDKKIKFKSGDFPVSYAVACSTAVPYPFHPLNIPKNYYANEEDFERVKPALVDGGIYDNQGIHKITQTSSSYKCDIVICSDGSSPFTRKFYNINPLPVLGRVMNVMMARIKNFQFIQHVYDTKEVGVSEIAYFSINWKYETCISGFCDNLKKGRIRSDVVNQHQIPDHISQGTEEDLIKFIKGKLNYSDIIQDGLTDEEVTAISNIGTSLHSLDAGQIKLLSKHAEVLTELQLRLYCPSLFS